MYPVRNCNSELNDATGLAPGRAPRITNNPVVQLRRRIATYDCQFNCLLPKASATTVSDQLYGCNERNKIEKEVAMEATRCTHSNQSKRPTLTMVDDRTSGVFRAHLRTTRNSLKD